MNNRILVRVKVLKEEILLKTVSREFKAPHFFYILKERILELENDKSIIVKNYGSYAELSLIQSTAGRRILHITFSWLKEEYNGALTGQKESVKLPYNLFYQMALQDTSDCEWKMLSIIDKSRPKIQFESRSNLHNAVSNPRVRKKLGQFFSCHFQWLHSQKIVLSDDGCPYSFNFIEYRNEGEGMFGAVILHGQEDMRTAYYGIHT